MTTQFLFMACLFSAVALVAFYLSKVIVGNSDDERLRERLTDGAAGSVSGGSKVISSAALAGAVPQTIWQRLGQAAAHPFMPKTREKQSDLRKSLSHAGIYATSAPRLVTGCKVILLAGGLLGGYAFGMMIGNLAMTLSVGGIVGYLIPALWLRIQIKKHQKELNYGLADALDLMVVCVEAGLTIDSALERVGQEMVLAHPRIAREFAITHMETRVGLARVEALKNMGQRTGSASLQSLAAMLIQADRFGTSIASALRIHAESLRSTRQHAAEEMAGKASVKLSFPLILFILPAALIVLVGPLVINFMKSGFLN